MEEGSQKFHERLKELLAYAKKRKNVLEYQEINDFFLDIEMSTDQMDAVFEVLEANNIDVLRIPDLEEIDDEEIDIDDSEDEDLST